MLLVALFLLFVIFSLALLAFALKYKTPSRKLTSAENRIRRGLAELNQRPLRQSQMRTLEDLIRERGPVGYDDAIADLKFALPTYEDASNLPQIVEESDDSVSV